jgi:GT2 family glycosyltransferase
MSIDIETVVDQPAGAFLCFRREAFETVGGFNESFWPVWFEDVDFCLRLSQFGYTLRFTPLASARHAGAQSIRKILWSSKELAWYGSLLRYATLQFGWLSRRLVGLAVAAASVPRSLSGILFRHQSVRTLGVYARVLSLALGVVVTGRVDERRNPLPRGSALQNPGYFE